MLTYEYWKNLKKCFYFKDLFFLFFKNALGLADFPWFLIISD
jgi:hypothetical protein